jgi:hypothetical protein
VTRVSDFRDYAEAMGVQGNFAPEQWQKAYEGDQQYQQVQAQAAADAMKALEVGRIGVPGQPPMPQGGVGSILPPQFSDPVTGGFHLPEGTAAQLRRMGLDPQQLSQTVNRNLLERTGADYQTRLLYGQSPGKRARRGDQAAHHGRHLHGPERQPAPG